MIAIFADTETNGLPRNYKAPHTDVDNWPRIVQVAWQIWEDAELPDQAKQVATQSHMIKPDGWTIDKQTAAIHGIDQATAEREGVPILDVMELLEASVILHTPDTLICHNVGFDRPIILAEMVRCGMATSRIGQLATRCTMAETTDWCNIPGCYGPKWPRLNELHQKLFGCEPEGQHRADADVALTVKCWHEAIRKGALK